MILLISQLTQQISRENVLPLEKEGSLDLEMTRMMKRMMKIGQVGLGGRVMVGGEVATVEVDNGDSCKYMTGRR